MSKMEKIKMIKAIAMTRHNAKKRTHTINARRKLSQKRNERVLHRYAPLI